MGAMTAGVTYEYKTAVLTGGFLGRHKEELKRSDLDQHLAEAGREGWDLVHILIEKSLQGKKNGHVLIFRRIAT